MTARIRISSPADLVAVMPQVMGFHVGDSLVLAGMAAGHLTGTVRFDADMSPEDAAAVMKPLLAHGVAHALVAAWGPESAQKVDVLVDAAREAGITVIDAGRVEGTEWVSQQTGTRTALPGLHSELPVPAYSREALAEAMVPRGSEETAAVLDAAGQVTSEQVPAALEAWAALLDGHDPDALTLATALPLLANTDYRDLLLATLTGETTVIEALAEVEHADRFREVLPQRVSAEAEPALLNLCGATPARHAPNVLAVAAAVFMVHGKGAHGMMLAEQAQQIDPTHRLAQLIQTACENGVDMTPA